MRYPSNGVARLSSKTYYKDTPQMVRDYLRSIGHERAMIADAEVWVRREKNKIVAVGGSEEEVKGE